MKISGFSMARNADKLYYPWKEAILSILPIVDEFVVAIGKGDEDDKTRDIIASIDSDKIKIIDTEWDLNTYDRGTENAHQTDIAKNACSGDWLFYLQADEVVHEKYLPVIKQRCEELLHNTEVEGLLFKYTHFWGDYHHYHQSHGWYPYEIRIVRNDPDIHSWESAQSFRRIPNFDGKDYRQQEGTHKLKVASVDAHIYHYGWVRPPELMQNKKRSLDTIHRGEKRVAEQYAKEKAYFDFGPLNKLATFKGTHPEVMREWMSKFDWENQLRMDGPFPTGRELLKHEKLKYRMVSWIENNLNGGTQIGAFKNYRLLKV